MSYPWFTVQQCPALATPANAQLDCFFCWTMGECCTVTCDAGYSLPWNAPPDGRFQCNDRDGVWMYDFPLDDCTGSKLPCPPTHPSIVIIVCSWIFVSTAQLSCQKRTYVDVAVQQVLLTARVANESVTCGSLLQRRYPATSVGRRLLISSPTSTARTPTERCLLETISLQH